MPIVDVPTLRVDLPTPAAVQVTPGLADADKGSDSPSVGNWASTLDSPLLSGVASVTGTLGAAFRQNNIVGAGLAAEDRDPGQWDYSFKPYASIKGTPYEQHWDRFITARNEKHADAIKRQIDQETEDKRTLDGLPWYARVPAEITAGTLDLPSLIPGGAFVRGAKGGFSIARSALEVGAAAGLSSAVQETGLHAIQETRTGTESAVNIGASVFLGGLLGAGGAKLLSNAEWRAHVDTIDRVLSEPAPAGAVPEMTGAHPSSVGAAALEPHSLGETEVAGAVAGGVAKATQKINPAMRIAQSDNAMTREVGSNLFEMSTYMRGNQDGLASPIAAETLRKEWDGGLMQAVQATRSTYSTYRKAGGDLSRSDFEAEVGKAMRRSDQSDIPEVAAAAKAWRSQVFDPLKDAAIKAKLLPEDVSVDTAASYFSRMWKRGALIAEEPKFKDAVRGWVTDQMPKWTEQFDKAAERRVDPLRREIDDLEMSKLRRSSEAKQREDGGEIEAGDFSEGDIRQAIRMVQGGAPKPKGVKTLTQFIADSGGMVDYGGELAALGITNRTRPGFIRAERRTMQGEGGGWSLDDMARHSWEKGYFPDHTERPTISEFLESLGDDFNKRRAVVVQGDRDAYRLQELINQLEQDLHRVGVDVKAGARFSTSEEVKGIISRVYKAMDAEADGKIAKIKKTLTERETEIRLERESKFIGDPRNMGDEIANEVFNKLTGRAGEGVRPEFIKINARGPLKERTFNIPDELVERWLESDVSMVGRRYQRIMSADVELANKFGTPDMAEALQKVRDGYDKLRADVTDPKMLTSIAKQERGDIRDLSAVRDIIRGIYGQNNATADYGYIFRIANSLQYILKMGQVVLSSLTEPVRVVAAKGLLPFMADGFKVFTSEGRSALKLSVAEARLAGNINDKILAHRLSTLADINDFYSSQGPVEKFMANLTNVASTWNGIRMWTDAGKSLASTMIQNQILKGVEGFAKIAPKEKRYLAFVGIDEGMAGRIAKQFAEHGEDMGGVKVANTSAWTDPVAVRTYRAALNKDLDSMVVTKGAADVPLFAQSPMGRLILQFNTFNLASHQRILMRGLQEGQARFLGTVVALSTMGMMQTYLSAVASNRLEKLPSMKDNPGWWISESLDRSGIFSVPFQVANGVEKLTGFNPIKSPMKLGDEGRSQSQRMANRNELGAVLGPTAGTIQDVGSVASIGKNLASGEDITAGQKSAATRLVPFNSYAGVRQLLNYIINPPQN